MYLGMVAPTKNHTNRFWHAGQGGQKLYTFIRTTNKKLPLVVVTLPHDKKFAPTEISVAEDEACFLAKRCETTFFSN